MATAIIGCGTVGKFEITDVSKEYTFFDSSLRKANCCFDILITGELDGPAWIHIKYYPNTKYWVDSIYLPKGVVDSVFRRQDFYSNKIIIKYFPGDAKKGNLRIRTQIL